MKRFLAWLLCLLMLVSVLPLGVLAQDGDTPESEPAADAEPAPEKEPEPEPAPEPAPEVKEEPTAEEPVEEPEPEPAAPEEPEQPAVPETEPEEPEAAPEEPVGEEPAEEPAAPPVITLKKLEDAAITAGVADFCVIATVEPKDTELSYQWQQLFPDAEDWEDMPGENSQCLTFTDIEDPEFFHGVQFRCAVRAGGTLVYSNAASMFVPEAAPETEEEPSELELEARCTHPQKYREEGYDIEPVNGTFTDNGDGTHSGQYRKHLYWMCIYCGYVKYYEYEQPYTVNNEQHEWDDKTGSVCTVCGALNTCTHERLEAQDTVDYNCDKAVNNGNGTHTAPRRDGTEYWCPDCEAYWTVYGNWYTVTEKHSFDGSGETEWECWICGATCNHPHMNVRSDPLTWHDSEDMYADDNGDGTHTYWKQDRLEYFCPDCEYEDEDHISEPYQVTEKHDYVERDEDEGGGFYCWMCGAVNPCTHPNAEYDGECFSNDFVAEDAGDGTHYVLLDICEYFCPDCGMYFDQKREYPYEEGPYEHTDWDDDCYCDDCGALMPFTGTISFEPSYCIAETYCSQHYFLKVEPAVYAPLVQVSVAKGSEGILGVDTEAGTVTGYNNNTTGYIVATLTVAGKTTTATCRFDFVEDGQAVTDIELLTASATSYVLKDEYAQVSLLPVLDQNLAPLDDGESDTHCWMLSDAKFTDEAIQQFFTLRIVNDRTLAVVPTETAIEYAQTGNRALKSSYTSQIKVYIGSTEYSVGRLKLSVKKTKPVVKAKTLSFLNFGAAIGKDLQLSGEEILSIEPDTAAAAKAKKPAVPPYIELDTDEQLAFLLKDKLPSRYASKGTIYLLAHVKGWIVPASVKVPFTIKKTAPKMTFSKKSVTLFAGTDEDVLVKMELTPEEYESSDYPILVEKVEIKSGSRYKKITNGTGIACRVAYGDTLYISAPQKPEDNKAHTYRITLSVAGKKFTYPVNVVTTASVKLKTEGFIHSQIPESYVSLQCSVGRMELIDARYVPQRTKIVRIEQYKGIRLEAQDVADALFEIEHDELENSFLIYPKDLAALPSGYSYKVIVGVDMDGDGIYESTAKTALQVTVADTAPAISVSLKTKGCIDLARPGSDVTVMYTVKNWPFDTEEWLVFSRKEGGEIKKYEAGDHVPFTSWNNSDGTFTVLANEYTELGKTYYVAVRTVINGVPYLSPNVALPVKKGKVTVSSNVSSLVMYKLDRLSRAPFALTVADETVAEIDRLELDAASAERFTVADQPGGTYALAYKDDTLPTFPRSTSTVTVSVFVKGCPQSVAKIKLKVSYK